MVQSSGLRLRVRFYRSSTGREPVREWLRSLDDESKKILGEDIKTVQFGWPVGMPLVRSLGNGLWEVRSRIPRGAARVIFLAEGDLMVLLHGFIKKARRTAKKDLAIAGTRARRLRAGKGDEKRTPRK
jgi:phage-related protein